MSLFSYYYGRHFLKLFSSLSCTSSDYLQLLSTLLPLSLLLVVSKDSRGSSCESSLYLSGHHYCTFYVRIVPGICTRRKSSRPRRLPIRQTLKFRLETEMRRF